MKMHRTIKITAIAVAFLAALCAVLITEPSETDGAVDAVTVNSISLNITGGEGHWTVNASGWDDVCKVTFTVYHDEEELFSTVGSISSGEDFRFSTGGLPIWRGTEYTIEASCEDYKSGSLSYTTLDSLLITGPSSIEVGDRVILTLHKGPSNASGKNFIWSVSDSSLATVENGMIYAKKTGTIYVKAASAENPEIFTSKFMIKISDSSEIIGYRIDVSSNEGGTAEAEKTRAFPDEWVQLEYTPDEGYEFIDWEANVPITVIDDYNAFQMPAYAVKIKALFRETYPEYMAVREANTGTALMPIPLLESKGMYDDENLKAEIDITTDYPSNIPKSASVYSVSITYNDIEATDFGGLITIILNYQNIGGDIPSVYSVSGDGNNVYKLEAEYDSSLHTMTFQTAKITLFAISDTAIEPLVEGVSSNIFYVVLAAVFILIIAGTVIYFRR